MDSRTAFFVVMIFFRSFSSLYAMKDELQQRISSFDYPEIKCSSCDHGKEANPSCSCVFPITGTLYFKHPSSTLLLNTSNLQTLQQEITSSLKLLNEPIETVVIRNIRSNKTEHELLAEIFVFPLRKENFTHKDVNHIFYTLSNNMYKSHVFGPFFIKPNLYLHSSDRKSSKSLEKRILIGVGVGTCILLVLVVVAGFYALMQKKRAQRATNMNNPFAMWDTSIDAPQLMGAKSFALEELKVSTNNFSEENCIGVGGYGKVYRGSLPCGQQIALKRAKQGSQRGDLEFKTEIEMLSRVHHKNIVRLLGFCFNQNEQVLVYEYVLNGSLKDSLSGKSGIQLDWTRRISIALDSAKGLAYLHEFADPPIIHRVVKSSNILLEESLTAKVADFGIAKLMGDDVITQVKGTMGYLDPEYCKTCLLSNKSDVFGFGIVLLELLTGKAPIERGKNVVTEVKSHIDKSMHLYGLQDLLDSMIITNNDNPKGFEEFVHLALRCVEEKGVDRPTMGEVVKELDNILLLQD